MKSKPPVPASLVSKRNALIATIKKTGGAHQADRERAAARVARSVERERSASDNAVLRTSDCC